MADQLAIACHRTVSGNGEKWQWIHGAPSLGALDNLKVHPSWRIEYAYSETHVAALQARIAELEARNAASERDAGRYAYLRDPPVHPFMPAWIAGRGNAHIEEDWLTGEQADAVIDAAIAKDPRKRFAIDAHAQGQK